jgi:hypothetical protein
MSATSASVDAGSGAPGAGPGGADGSAAAPTSAPGGRKAGAGSGAGAPAFGAGAAAPPAASPGGPGPSGASAASSSSSSSSSSGQGGRSTEGGAEAGAGAVAASVAAPPPTSVPIFCYRIEDTALRDRFECMFDLSLPVAANAAIIADKLYSRPSAGAGVEAEGGTGGPGDQGVQALPAATPATTAAAGAPAAVPSTSPAPTPDSSEMDNSPGPKRGSRAGDGDDVAAGMRGGGAGGGFGGELVAQGTGPRFPDAVLYRLAPTGMSEECDETMKRSIKSHSTFIISPDGDASLYAIPDLGGASRPLRSAGHSPFPGAHVARWRGWGRRCYPTTARPPVHPPCPPPPHPPPRMVYCDTLLTWVLAAVASRGRGGAGGALPWRGRGVCRGRFRLKGGVGGGGGGGSRGRASRAVRRCKHGA